MTAGQAAQAATLGVGASLRRKEDARFLHGLGRFVGDITRPGMLEVAFLRSPVAHARLLGVTKPAGAEKRVFTLADLGDVRTIRANSALPGFRVSEQPALATGKLRHVGEAIAACVADTRAEAEDLVAACELDYETLPAVHDMLAAPLPAQPLIHDGWSMNAFLETRRDDDVGALDAIAAAKVTRTLRTSRQCMAPIEGRGVLAEWDPRLEQMIVTTSTQMPHVTKSGLADCLGLDEGQVRIVSPDVGGGFGYKGILLPEEIVCASIARRLGRPVRWLEDRYEQLSAGANCREHHYVITAWADRAGKLLGMECEATVDAGAYSSYPFGACLEAAQVGSILPGPYILPLLRCHTISACTNKPPILPYRGVARTGVCYAMETTLDALARQLGITAQAIRLANLVPPDAMPYRNLVGKVFDSGDYPEALRRAVAAFDLDADPRAPGQGRSGGLRPRHLLRAGCARHVGLSRLGHSLRAGLRAGLRPAQSRRRAGSARGRAQSRPGHGDDLGAGRARDPGHPSRQGARGPWRHRPHALFDRHLGQPRHGDGRRRGGRGLPPARPARRCDRRGAVAGAAGRCRDRRRPGAPQGQRQFGDGGLRHHRRRGLHLVSRAAEPAARCRQGRAGNHRGLPAGSRYRHALLCLPRLRGAGRHRDRRRRARGLSDRRGWRQAGEPHDRRRPGAGRPGAGHRHRALRGDAVRRGGPAAGRDPRGLSAARHDRGARRAARSHGDAEPMDDLRPEGHRRKRRHRPAGRDRERDQRCAGAARRRGF